MTKEITKAIIMQEIQDRFKLRELVPETFAFSEMVVPIYNLENHLKKWETYTITHSVTATTSKEIFKVPDGERWTLTGYTSIFMASGAYTIAGYYIKRKNSSTIFVYTDLAAAKSASYTINLPKPIIFDSGDSFHVNVDGYTSTANLMTNADIVKEELQ